MNTHAPLSPSSAYRFMRCPGSVREQAKYPEKPSGPGAVDGTHTHTLLEYCIKNSVDLNAMSMVGQTMTDHEGSFIVDADRAKRVQVALDHVNSIGETKLTDAVCLFGAAKASAEHRVSVIAEQRVNPAHLIGRDDMSGTVDIQVHAGDTLHVIDYKDGMNEVTAKDNEQLELYALGVLAGFKLPINVEYPFKNVTMTIIQPKLVMRGGNPITSHTMTVREVLDLIPKYVVGGAAVDKSDAPLVPGDKQCKYCRASGCSARAQEAMKMSGITFPSLPAEVQQVSDQVAAQDPASMTSDQLRQILEAAPLMRQTIEQAEAEAQRRLESGQSVPGLKLVYGRGSQAWSIPEDQVVEKLKGMGVPKDAVYKTSVVSPAQAKKLVWTKRDGTTKQLSERQLKTLETEYIAKLGGKLTVALESDPRVAVVRDAAPLFSAVQPAPVEQPALPSWLS